MRAAALLMPSAAGRCWLAEAESYLAEVDPALRRGAVVSWLASAPETAVVAWAGEVTQLARGSAGR